MYNPPEMAKNRVFFPQNALDQWLHEEKIELGGTTLVIKAEGRKYRLIEAVRVLAEVTGAPDEHELIGKVKTVNFLSELGAELLGTSMILGDLAYEVVPGFVATPVGSFAEHRQGSVPPPPARGMMPTSDEEILAQYLIQNLD
jgi:hypothetical protein